MALKNPITGGTWVNISLHPDYAETGSPYLVPAYRKDSYGIVHLRGRISYVLGSGSGTRLLTLPSGFRPLGTSRFMAPGADANYVTGIAWLDLSASGTLDYVAGGVYTVALDQISFASY